MNTALRLLLVPGLMAVVLLAPPRASAQSAAGLQLEKSEAWAPNPPAAPKTAVQADGSVLIEATVPSETIRYWAGGELKQVTFLLRRPHLYQPYTDGTVRGPLAPAPTAPPRAAH